MTHQCYEQFLIYFHFYLKAFSQKDLPAVRILLDENEINHSHCLIKGKDLLCSFLTYKELYGNKLTVYNVVNLLHFGEDSYFPKLNLDDFITQSRKLFVSP